MLINAFLCIVIFEKSYRAENEMENSGIKRGSFPLSLRSFCLLFDNDRQLKYINS